MGYRIPNPSDEMKVAIHEAGHAVMSIIFLGSTPPIENISIVSNEESLGRVTVGEIPGFDDNDDEEFLLRLIILMVVYLGGLNAEGLAFGDFDDNGTRGDIRKTRKIAQVFYETVEKRREFMLMISIFTAGLLKEHWKAVRTLADYLVEHKECDPDTAKIIVLTSFEPAKEGAVT